MATTTTDVNKRLARRVPEEIATAGNTAAVAEVYAADAVEHAPDGDYEGHAAITENMADILAAFPDFEATVDDIVAEGDTVAMRVTLRGTHEGEFMGVEPTGRSVEIENMVFTRIEDGKITERWLRPDMFGLMSQLGVVDVPLED